MNSLVVNANALHIPLRDNSVHCCVTSPPYFGLRDYGTATWVGGDPECNHIPSVKPISTRPNLSNCGIGKSGYEAQNPIYKDTCGKCGAVRIDHQIGLEQTPEQYVENLVKVFREVWRVLRDDGTVWLNIGDSFTQLRHEVVIQARIKTTDADKRKKYSHALFGSELRKVSIPSGLKPKDLVGIPWRVAFALQADGWYLRQDIIWAKGNPMPESVTDRCTKAHEYIFLLSKSARYWSDFESIKENSIDPESYKGRTKRNHDHFVGEFGSDTKSGFVNIPQGKIYSKRNKRSVWTVNTKPYKGAHFAVFPPKLIEPCILAGCPEKVCPVCGKGWKRVYDKIDDKHWTERQTPSPKMMALNETGFRNDTGGNFEGSALMPVGWKPSCNCGRTDYTNGIVIDPFSGTATTGLVAIKNGRSYIGTELNRKYINLSQERVDEDTVKIAEFQRRFTQWE